MIILAEIWNKMMTFQEKIDKNIEAFLSDEKKYKNFWNKIHSWLKQHHAVVEKTLRRFDIEEYGVVPFDVFKAGRPHTVPVLSFPL